jgi:hypothetical protein
MKLILLISFLLFSLPGFTQGEEIKFDENKEGSHFNIAIELQKAGFKSLEAKDLLNEKVVALIKRAFKENSIGEQPVEIQRAIIMGAVKNQPIEKVFLHYPKLLDIVTALVADKEAIPSLLNIVVRKNDLKIFGWISLSLLVSGFLFRKFIVSKKAGFIKRLLIRTCLGLGLACTSMTIFYHMFEAEVSPTIRVVKSRF